MAYHPIENYGIIGDMRTVALVGKHGSIDWLCYPYFDSPSVFGALLDAERGGHFEICPFDTEYSSKQFYWPETNVLATRFLSQEGVCELTDYMPVGKGTMSDGAPRLVRRLKMVRGEMRIRIRCRPAFDYGRHQHDISLHENGAAFHSPDLSLGLATSEKLNRKGPEIVAHLKMKEGDTANFVLKEIQNNSEAEVCFSEEEAYAGFKETIHYWRRWLSQCTYTGRWREMVHRSALTLKLLTFEPTGAIVAAPTCSLPEAIGGHRNWDYRYTWIRDAAFTIYAFLRIGFTQEAAAFMNFIRERCQEREDDGSLQIVYSIHGEHTLEEVQLDHLEGYRQSRPVRIGNAAYKQLQMDIYGELMDSVYLFNKHGTPISYDFWKDLRELIEYTRTNWTRKDEGIWETRGDREHFVYSKFMCWVALDRALRLAHKRSFPAPHAAWMETRDQIYLEIMEKGWSEERQAFVQSYGSSSLDASLLMMPLAFFVSPTDERMLQTIEAMRKSPEEGGLLSNGLVFRYNSQEYVDGLSGKEGTFNICTFWMVEALTRAGRFRSERLEEARLMFEQMLGYANHLGLYAEETGARGESLGNFPQAFTHLSLISAAYNLNRALGEESL